jgi:hypothetical protein
MPRFLPATGTRPNAAFSVKATIRPVLMEAHVERIAAPRKELRRRQHQDEQQLRHEFIFCGDYAAFSSIGLVAAGQ